MLVWFAGWLIGLFIAIDKDTVISSEDMKEGFGTLKSERRGETQEKLKT